MGRTLWKWSVFGTVLCLVFGLPAEAQVKPANPGDEDYLTPELRAEVEALKAAVNTTARSRDEVAERAKTLYTWGNAFALAGGPIHDTLPLAVSQVLEGRPPGALIFVRQFPMLVEDLRIKEEEPGALGTVSSDDTGPFEAGSFVTIRQTYTVGKKPMVEGGVLFIAREYSADHGTYQMSEPAGDNYVSVTSSNPDATFSAIQSGIFGPHGTFVTATPMLSVELAAATLEEGDTITVTYGDTSEGSRGFQVNNFEGDGFQLPLYVDLDGNGLFLRPAFPAHAIHGTTAKNVKIFAPSVVGVGEGFVMLVRTEDWFINPAKGPIPEYIVRVDRREIGTIPAGDAPVHGIACIVDEPGIVYATAISADGKIWGRSNPIWVRDDPTHGIYWGDTHAHIGYSEGVGSVEHFFNHARNHAYLDFVSLTEHDVFLDDYEWKTLVDGTAKYHDDGKFVTFLGYEWTAAVQTGGHHNILFRNLKERKRVPVQETRSLEALYEGLRAGNAVEDVVTIPHAHAPGDWSRSDADLERVIEITSMHGTFEWFGNNYLQQGHKVGFVGASDDHRARPGYTGVNHIVTQQFGGLGAVLAPERTGDAVFDAIRNRATYATTGQRMLMAFDLDGIGIGQDVKAEDAKTIQGWVAGTEPVERVDIVKNGNVVWTQQYLTDAVRDGCTILVSFESESDPRALEVPRGTREWKGSIAVTGATLAEVKSPGFENVYYETASIDASEPNTATFYDRTRGQADTLTLTLSGATADTTLHVSVEAGEEGEKVLVVNPRGPQTFAATEFSVTLGDVANTVVEETFTTGLDTDRIRVQVLPASPKLRQSIEYALPEAPKAGDYYYVRARQLDGGMAWTSPWFIGE